MIVVYNILQLLALLILGPVLAVWGFASPKYRHRIPRRLGLGLSGSASGLPPGPRVWIHALSVGEMASVRPLLSALRRHMPEVVVILSATTRSGEEFARRLDGLFDRLVPFPFDGYWIVSRFIRLLRPEVFVLVETDFWPNLLTCLNRAKVKCLLVNGRVTSSSMDVYQRFGFLFAPVFSTFWRISMQMADDAQRLVDLGVDAKKIVVCGNLKYDLGEDLPEAGEVIDLGVFGRSRGLLIVAGSTHEGEEEVVLNAFVALMEIVPTVTMVIAPRDVRRARRVSELCEERGIDWSLRSARSEEAGSVLILDTLGELAQVYRLADIAFVGGSLVDEGGHNPLEPARFSVPILFGTYMSDFAEISRDLLLEGGARVVTNDTFFAVLRELLVDEGQRLVMGRCAESLLAKHRGATRRCLALIREAIDSDR